jgi:hypothetical protein
MPDAETRRYPQDPQTVYNAAYQLLTTGKGLKLVAADPNTRVLQGSVGMSLMSWGENMDVAVTPDGAGSLVSVTVKLKAQLVDWGKRKKDLALFFNGLDAVLGTGGTVAAAPVAQTPAGWYADPSGRAELRYWDGAQWTEHVSTAGQQSTAPV